MADLSQTPGRRWVLVDLALVPDEFRDRAIPMALIPLLPGESFGAREGPIPDEDAPLASLVTQGHDVDAISKKLHISRRTAYRRLANLRRHVGANTTAELSTKLARLGF